MKGWIDKCLVYGHSWTAENTFSKGIFRGKKALAVVTCDDTKENYSRNGLQGMTIEEMLHHFNKATMGFIGVTSLKPYAFYTVSRYTQEQREILLKDYGNILSDFDSLPVYK
jgi:NAD(P)H dehydrogenase (quinone)